MFYEKDWPYEMDTQLGEKRQVGFFSSFGSYEKTIPRQILKFISL